MHPLVAPVVDALEALGGWKPPGPGELVDELNQFLPGLQAVVGILGATLADVADTLEDTPIAKEAIDVLWEMLKVSSLASGDDVWAAWRQVDAADIDRAENRRVGEEQYNVDGAAPAPPTTLAATAPADPDDEPGQPVMCTGMVACRQLGCGEVFEYTATVAPGWDAGGYADNAAMCAASDVGWHIRPPRWFGCPAHPGGAEREIQVVCQWRCGDNFCYASDIGRYFGDSDEDRWLQAAQRLGKFGWHFRYHDESAMPTYVGCYDHPRQYFPPGDVLDRIDPDGRSDLARHLRSGEVARRKIGTGYVGETSFVDLADGTTVIEKRANDTNLTGIPAVNQQDAEELAAAVLRAMGLRAPEVIRIAPDLVFMSRLPGQPAGDSWDTTGERLENVARIADTGVGRLIGAVDVLVDNWDRHDWNWLIDNPDDPDLQPGLVDHGACFSDVTGYRSGEAPPLRVGRDRDKFSSPYVNPPRPSTRSTASTPATWADNPLHPDDVAEMKRRIETTRPEFERLGRNDWYQFMLQRAEKIEQHATGAERLTWQPAR